jgi:anti-sigma factor RsiW
MSCPTPFETLVSWWLGDLPETEAAALEEHLFACDACSAASARLGSFVAGLREWVPPVISHAHRDRLAAAGKRIQLTPVDAGVDARFRFAPELDLGVHVLRGDFARAERVDVEVSAPGYDWRVVIEQVPFDRAAGEVLVACQRHYEHMFTGDPVFEVFAVTEGERRRVGLYHVAHEWA